MLDAMKRSGSFLGVVAAFGVLLVACGEDAPRTVELRTVEYAFEVDDPPNIQAGERIRFRVTNAGQLVHEMQVLDATGRVYGRTARIAPGAVDDVTVAFEDAGSYTVICDVDDHLSRGQRAAFSVSEPGG